MTPSHVGTPQGWRVGTPPGVQVENRKNVRTASTGCRINLLAQL